MINQLPCVVFLVIPSDADGESGQVCRLGEGIGDVQVAGEALSLHELDGSVPGLTQARATTLAEAAAVCLENQQHRSGTSLVVDGEFEKRYTLHWGRTTEQIRRCHADMQDATEEGACGIGILLILRLTEYTVIEQSRKGTAVDYWLGSKDNEAPFQNMARLEVSGILRGIEADIRARVQQKLRRIQSSAGALPTYVVVVEFREPRSRVVAKCGN